MNRSTAFRLPCFFTFLCISTTDLQSVVIGKWITRHPNHWPGSRSQISNRIQDGLVEFVQSFPLQPPVEHSTYVPAIPSKLNIIPVVSQSVLDRAELAARLHRLAGTY